MTTTQPCSSLLRLPEVALRPAEIILKVSPGNFTQSRPGQTDLSLQSLERVWPSVGTQTSLHSPLSGSSDSPGWKSCRRVQSGRGPGCSGCSGLPSAGRGWPLSEPSLSCSRPPAQTCRPPGSCESAWCLWSAQWGPGSPVWREPASPPPGPPRLFFLPNGLAGWSSHPAPRPELSLSLWTRRVCCCSSSDPCEHRSEISMIIIGDYWFWSYIFAGSCM